MTEENYSNVGNRGPVYKGLGAMNPCDNQSTNAYRNKHKQQRQLKETEIRLEGEAELDVCGVYRLLNKRGKKFKNL
jgi:hypothetical protein